MLERNSGVSPDRRIEFRIGIHIGDIVEESDGDLMGDGVNFAARLEGIAEPNGICLSGAAYEQVRDKLKEESRISATGNSKTLHGRCESIEWPSTWTRRESRLFPTGQIEN